MCNDRLRLMLEVGVVQQLRFWAKLFLFACLTSMTRGLRRCLKRCIVSLVFGLDLGWIFVLYGSV